MLVCQPSTERVVGCHSHLPRGTVTGDGKPPLAQAYKSIPVGVPVAAHTLHTCAQAPPALDFLGSGWVPLLLCTPTPPHRHSLFVALVGHSAGTRWLMPPLATVLSFFSGEAWLPPPPVDTVQAAKPIADNPNIYPGALWSNASQ